MFDYERGDRGERSGSERLTWALVRRRLGWDPPESVDLDSASDTAMMARFVIYVSAIGATVGLAALAVNPDGPRSVLGVLVVIALAYLVALVLLWRFDTLPKWVYPAAAIMGTAAISAEIYFSDPRADLGIFYLTVSIAVFFFFPWRMAAFQVAAIAVMYAVVLFAQDKPAPVAMTSWLAVVGVSAAVGFLLSRIRDRVDWLVARLDDAARTDPLTGLLNRRGFERRFTMELERARRSEGALSLLVLDLDNFKQVNDRLGHQAGDDVLQRIGLLLHDEKRVVDVAGRLGGEEFGLLLPSTGADGVLGYAQRLRAAVEMHFADSDVTLTTSIGAACFPAHGVDSDSLMRAADRALYVAKETGRNRCVVYELDAIAS